MLTLSKKGRGQNTIEYESTPEDEKGIFPVKLKKNSKPTSSESQSAPVGKLAIFWDLRRCLVPKGVPYDTVAANIKCFLSRHGIHGQITTFNVYGDASKLPKAFIKGCNKTGINLIDEKDTDSVQKTMLVDMIVCDIDHRSRLSNLLLITGRKFIDFFPVLSSLQNSRRGLLAAVPNLKKTSLRLPGDLDLVCEWSEMAMAGNTGQDQLNDQVLTRRNEITCKWCIFLKQQLFATGKVEAAILCTELEMDVKPGFDVRNLYAGKAK